jgi:eukaryotic-like serine/threonine-protein kinase
MREPALAVVARCSYVRGAGIVAGRVLGDVRVGGGVLEALQLGDPVQVGPYRLLGVLGEGGFGRVFLGQSANGRQVALKLILASHTDPEFLQRFRREAAAAARVSGRFTAPLVAADLGGPVPWLATEYVAGLSLAEQVRTNGPAPARSVLVLAAGLAEALEAIHAAGVVHRDLKPGNVLLAWDGPRVIDFGIARAAGSSTLTGTGTVIGTPEFMSPEQARGEEAGPASDVFSLGSVVAFAATGRPPFGSDYPAVLFRIMSQPADLGGLADERVRQLITGCLAKDPAWRPTPRGLLDYLGGAHPAPDWLSGPDPPINGSAPPLSRPAASAVRPAPATPPAPPPSAILLAPMMKSVLVIIGTAVLATAAGAIQLATFLSQGSNLPYLQAVVILGRIAAWTAIPALIASWLFDLTAWRRGFFEFATLDWPKWHRDWVVAGAVIPPVPSYVAYFWVRKGSLEHGALFKTAFSG